MSSSQRTKFVETHVPLHNPLPASLSRECKKAARILDSFINPRFFNIDGGIPKRIVERAKGLVIFTALKAAFLGSVRFGSGVIVARLPDGSWSAPSAIATGGIGAGGQFGLELTDFVFALTTDEAVQTLTQSGSLTIGGNISIAFGPFGRSAEGGAVTGQKGTATMFAYSKTRGIYGGATIEGGLLGERADANKKMYGRKISAKELLAGELAPPPEVEPLMRILNSDVFRCQSPSDTTPQLPSEQPLESISEDPSQGPNEPPQGITQAAADRSMEPELPGDTQETVDLSPGHGSVQEVDSPQDPSMNPPQQVSEGASQGITEVAADRSVEPELPLGDTQETVDLSTGDSHNSVHEVDSPRDPSMNPSQQVSE